MNYKHGNWYCKPANEEEAHEIVKRAVVSGATCKETIEDWGWDTYGPWGVHRGCTHTQTVDFYHGRDYFTEYTIEQLREKFPLPIEQGKKAPVYTHEYRYSQSAYRLCKVVVSETDTLGKILVEDQYGEYDLIPLANLRPLPSERDKWVEHALNLHSTYKSDLKSFMYELYDTIKSGDPKTTDAEKLVDTPIN